jgi:hypothetical protein
MSAESVPQLRLLKGPEVAHPVNSQGGLYMQVLRDGSTSLSEFDGQLADLATRHGYNPNGRVTKGPPCSHGLTTVTQAVWFHDKAAVAAN